MPEELRNYFSLLSSLGITYHEGDRIAVFPWQGPLSRRDALAAASRTANLVGSGGSEPSPLLVEVIRAARAAGRHWFAEVPKRARARSLNFGNLYDSDGRFVVELADRFVWEDIAAVLESRACKLEAVELSGSDTDPLVNTADLLPLVEVVGPDGRILAGGNGPTYQEAKRGAVAEGVERLLAQTPLPSTVFLASARDLRQDGFLVPDFELAARDAYTEELYVEWIGAERLTGEQAVLPAELAYYNYEPRSGIRAFGLQHTAGLAAGTTVEEAIWAGLSECLERDAYWLVMRCRLPCPTLPNELLGDHLPHLMTSLTAAGLRLILKHISLDWPLAIVHALLVDESGRIPAFSHGTGSHTTLPRAAVKAVQECLQIRSGLVRFCKRYRSDVLFPSVRDTGGGAKEPHAAWSDPASAVLLSHLYHEPSNLAPVTSAHRSPIGPQEIIANVEHMAGPVFWTKLGALGHLSVVRVFVPNCVPPDHNPDVITKRMKMWLNRVGLSHPYDVPILT